MISILDNIIFIFFATFTVAMIVLFAFSESSSAATAKARLDRTARPRKSEAAASPDTPSIVSERSKFLQQNSAFFSNASVRTLVGEFDALLRVCRISWNVAIFLFVVILIMSSLAALMLDSVIGIHAAFLFSALFISLCLIFLRTLILIKGRQLDRFQQVFPDALDLIVRSVRAGLPVSEAIKVISEEVSSPVNESFREVASQLSIGMTLDESLGHLQKTVPLSEVRFFAISLSIQQETGGNLAEILANSASIMRKRAQLAKKIKAFSSEARASAFIIGSLPFVVGTVIYFLNREYLEVLFLDEVGQLFLMTAIGSIAVGAFIIARMIRFEV